MNRLLHIAIAFLLTLSLVACRQHGVYVQITNGGSQTISNIQVEFPGGTYGLGSIDAGQNNRRWIKIDGQGSLKVTYQDASHTTHTVEGGVFNSQSTGEAEFNIGDGGQFQFRQTFGKK